MHKLFLMLVAAGLLQAQDADNGKKLYAAVGC
jgi:hypothetical protein